MPMETTLNMLLLKMIVAMLGEFITTTRTIWDILSTTGSPQMAFSLVIAQMQVSQTYLDIVTGLIARLQPL